MYDRVCLQKNKVARFSKDWVKSISPINTNSYSTIKISNEQAVTWNWGAGKVYTTVDDKKSQNTFFAIKREAVNFNKVKYVWKIFKLLWMLLTCL